MFQDEVDSTLSVNGDQYRENFFYGNKTKIKTIWFQQDAHARVTIALLRTHFRNRIISSNGVLKWPRRSPDLTVPDYFLWGYVKERVHVCKQTAMLGTT